ncbi:collagen alpha-1(I) chain-like [Strigops habroptila]|uniref:collagen alpha-1(I) chain-like n=1 Tax=Strigops habroptila TaxID=2489341 RepID=UPI0011CF5605|nr:collagen alpha-1(I) chain-like [Strigops habroptila]
MGRTGPNRTGEGTHTLWAAPSALCGPARRAVCGQRGRCQGWERSRTTRPARERRRGAVHGDSTGRAELSRLRFLSAGSAPRGAQNGVGERMPPRGGQPSVPEAITGNRDTRVGAAGNGSSLRESGSLNRPFPRPKPGKIPNRGMLRRAPARRVTQFPLPGRSRAWDPPHQGPVLSGLQPPRPRRMRPGKASPEPVTPPPGSPPLSTSKPPRSRVGDPTVSVAPRIWLRLFSGNETAAPPARGSPLEAVCDGGAPGHSWLRDHVPSEPARCRGCGVLAFRRPETSPGGSTGPGVHRNRQQSPAGTGVVPVPGIVVYQGSCPVSLHERTWTSNGATGTAVPLRWGDPGGNLHGRLAGCRAPPSAAAEGAEAALTGGEGTSSPAFRPGISGGNSSFPRRDPRGIHAWPGLGPRFLCGGGPEENETQTRTARGKQRGAAAGSWGSGESPRAAGEPGPELRPRVGVLARKEKRDGASPAPRDETVAGGTVPGPSGSSSRCRRGPWDPLRRAPVALPRPRKPARATGRRSGARAPAALCVPGVNGRSCAGAPRGLGRAGACRLRAPPTPPAPTLPREFGGSARTRGRLWPGESVCRCGESVFRPSGPKSAPRPPGLRYPDPYSCDEPLGCQWVLAGHGVRLPPRFSLRGGCHGCRICNETGGLLPHPGTARGAAGRARVSERGGGAGGSGLRSNSRRDRSPRLLSALVTVLWKLLRPTNTRARDCQELAQLSSQAAWPQRCGRGEKRGPRELKSTSRLPGPEPTRQPGPTSRPGRGTLDPGRAAGTAGQGGTSPGVSFHENSLRVWTPPPHPGGSRSPVPDPPRRPVPLRASPGPVPSLSRLGKRFSSPVAERSRDEPRGKSTLPRAGAGLSRRGGRGLGDPSRTAGPRPHRVWVTPAARPLPLRFRTAWGEAGSQRPTPGCGTCPWRGTEGRRGDGDIHGAAVTRGFAADGTGPPASFPPRPEPRIPRCYRGCCRRGPGSARSADGRSPGVPAQRCPAGPLLPPPRRPGIPVRGSFRVHFFDIELKVSLVPPPGLGMEPPRRWDRLSGASDSGDLHSGLCYLEHAEHREAMSPRQSRRSLPGRPLFTGYRGLCQMVRGPHRGAAPGPSGTSAPGQPVLEDSSGPANRGGRDPSAAFGSARPGSAPGAGAGSSGHDPGSSPGCRTETRHFPLPRLIPGAFHRWHRPPGNGGRSAAGGDPATPGGAPQLPSTPDPPLRRLQQSRAPPLLRRG